MEGKELQDSKLENNEESADADQSSAAGAVKGKIVKTDG